MAFYQDPNDDAEKTLEQIPGTITPYYQPYINAGSQALGALGNQYSQLIGNNYNSLQSALTQMLSAPGQTLNKIGMGYQESPGYQWEVQQGTESANNAASAGGYLGTPQEQQYEATMTEGLANKDFYEWLNDALGVGKTGLSGVTGLYNEGLQGVEGINTMGYNASNQLAQGLMQYLNELAGEQYSSAVNQNEHNMGLLGDTLGFASNIVGDIFHPGGK